MLFYQAYKGFEMDFTKYFSLKYKAGARGDREIDCYGLVLLVQRECYAIDYFPDWREKGVLGGFHALKNMDETCKPYKVKKIDTPKNGAFVSMLSDQGFASHCGVYVNDGFILHIDENGVKLQKASELKNRIIGFYLWQ